MSATGSGTSGEEIWLPKGNPWVIAAAVSLAAFMEVLDTSIANLSSAFDRDLLSRVESLIRSGIPGRVFPPAVWPCRSRPAKRSAKHGRK